MKKLIYILIIVLLSGCSAKMDIDLDRDKVTETLIITTNKDYLEKISEDELASKLSDFEYGYENYKDEFIYESNNNISKKYTYTNDYENYKVMTFLNKCYSDVNIERRQDIIINTSSQFLCYDYFDDLEEIKIRIKSIYKVKNHNSDKREGKYYVWTINKENYLEKPIEITFSNEYDKEDTSSYKLLFIGLIIFGFVFFVLRKIKKANEY